MKLGYQHYLLDAIIYLASINMFQLLKKKPSNNSPAGYRISPHISAPDQNIIQQAETNAIELVKQAASRVPAYKDFLAKSRIDINKINHIRDFDLIPVMDKHNYLRQYPLQDLCWDGKISPLSIISSSSGSTGKPFYWPRGVEQELEGAQMHERLFCDIFDINTKRTLYINCFAMGTWVAGTYVLSSIERLSWAGYPIITVSPGIEKDQIVEVFKSLAPQFEQVILGGYPPFIKDVLDYGKMKNINWSHYKIKFLFAAEGFSEVWRRHVHSLVNAEDLYTTSINCYGSADAGLLAHETPLTINIRQHINQDEQLMEHFFDEARMPTLAQFDPRYKYFECVNDHQLIFSTRSGIPLIRYSIGDSGGVATYDEMRDAGLEVNYKWIDPKDPSWRLPFVWVFGRKDLTVSLYGALIFPEHIKYGLEKAMMNGLISGKFVAATENDEDKNQYLLIKVELAQDGKVSQKLSKELSRTILQSIVRSSSEVDRLHKTIGNKALPVVELLPNGSDDFKVGSKQKWVQA